MKKPKNSRPSRVSSENAEIKQDTILSQRVFLYLHPKSITCCLGDISFNRSEIELEHRYNTITTLSDRFTRSNVIRIDTFDVVKPTFSVTITRDSLEDITSLSDSPILLTLYVYPKNESKTSVTDEEDVRVPVAQGYIDIIEYFNNKRMHCTDTVFLYPFKNYGQNLSCKIEWEIYSLYPLLKTAKFSNFVFITLESLYNINEDLLNKAKHLVTNLSFIAKIRTENNEFDKIRICSFKTFCKDIISQQKLNISWESLKSRTFSNINSMGIATDSKINLNQLFSNLFITENVELSFSRINIAEDISLICNSWHRYVLTEDMQKILENLLSTNAYDIIVEVCSELDENITLLNGFIDLSVYMYPNVNKCSFAVELKPPGSKFNYPQSTKKQAVKKGEQSKMKSKTTYNSHETVIREEKIPFAIIKIRLSTPITNPSQDLIAISNKKLQHNKFGHYMATITTDFESSFSFNRDQHYKAFDDLMLEILNYIITNNIKTLNDGKEFFCYQLSNISNKIMKLVACDYNIKTPTKTNIEFKSLVTTVYKDLISRIYEYINKCSFNGLAHCVFTMTKVQNVIMENMSMAKYLYESGHMETADIFMNKLLTEYSDNPMFKFYIFLYDLERQKFHLVEKYLKSTLKDKDIEGELFADLIQIYVNYKMQLQHPEDMHKAEENLIGALNNYSMTHKPRSLTAFILLYCVYKRHNYKSGMEYCRWRYENLYESTFVKIEFIPKSRWEIHLPYKLNLKSLKGQNFFKVCEKLLRLGLYNFAQWVFGEIANECTEIEFYVFSRTFIILDNQMLKNLQVKQLSVEEYSNPVQLRAALSLVNGNLEHLFVTNGPSALKYYRDITELKELNEYEPYQLGVLRYAYKMLEDKKYEEASEVFLKLYNNKVIGIVAAVGIGKACYYLGQLDEAEKYFSLSTEHCTYIAISWAYLALINLKKGNNYNALECWKYFRLNKNIKIHQDIMDELNKINSNDIFLFVDVPNKLH